jgi:hypothetical protein
MNMLLARIVMIAKQIMSDLISKNPARNSAAMVPPPFSGRDLNIFPLHRRHEPLHRIGEFFLEKTSLGRFFICTPREEDVPRYFDSS